MGELRGCGVEAGGQCQQWKTRGPLWQEQEVEKGIRHLRKGVIVSLLHVAHKAASPPPEALALWPQEWMCGM